MACICLDTSSIPHEVRNYGLDIWDLAQRGTEEGLLRALNSEDRSESDVNYVYGIVSSGNRVIISISKFIIFM